MGQAAVAGLEVLRQCASLFPVETVSNLGGFLGRRLGRGSKRHRRALRCVRACLPDLSETQSARVVEDMWDCFGRTIAEAFVLDRIAADRDRVVLENPEVLETTTGAENGTIFAGLHFGNWECTALGAADAIPDLAGLYKASKDRHVDRWLRRHREPIYPGGLLAGDASSFLAMAKIVKKGGSICLLADHRDRNGVEVDFFGRSAPSLALPASFARRFGARLIAARTARRSAGRFSIRLEAIEVARTDDIPADIKTTTGRLQAVFEAWIREEPGAWMWFYKRWSDAD